MASGLQNNCNWFLYLLYIQYLFSRASADSFLRILTANVMKKTLIKGVSDKSVFLWFICKRIFAELF